MEFSIEPLVKANYKGSESSVAFTNCVSKGEYLCICFNIVFTYEFPELLESHCNWEYILLDISKDVFYDATLGISGAPGGGVRVDFVELAYFSVLVDEVD